MKVLITGVSGQVGFALTQTLTEHELIPLTRNDCDLTNLDEIKKVIDHHQPDLIINPAAFTQVDKAECDKELAFKINKYAPKVMAEKALEYSIPLIHFSTDYVFDGQKLEGYVEEDQTNPLGVYGKSKLEGEKLIQEIDGQYYIIRTSWVYSNIGNNFYLTMKRMCQNNNELKVVKDQVGTPSSNMFIAKQLEKIILQLNKNNIGIYHLVPDGSCSWYQFAKSIIEETNPQFNLDNLIPIQSSEYKTYAKRPKNSCLNNSKVKKAFLLDFNNWQKDLKYLSV